MSYLHKIENKTVDFTNKYATLILLFLLILISISFFYGWYFDSTKPVSGTGWADQTLYTKTAKTLAYFEKPTKHMFHFQMGYAILGALFYRIMPQDPFMLVSLFLLLGSVTLIFHGMKRITNTLLASFLIILLFIWDLKGSTFNYPSELFIVPWNNQVPFFTFSYLFWLITKDSDDIKSFKVIILTGIICGFCVATREETILFILPMMIILFVYQKLSLVKLILFLCVFIIAYAPQPVIKHFTFQSITAKGRSSDLTYIDFLMKYINIRRFFSNLKTVVIDARLSPFPWEEIRRKALFQSSPWLWLSIPGLVFLFASKKNFQMKLFATFTLILFVFYVSGPNMSERKLKFHCIRYISSSLIMLNYSIINLLKIVYEKIKRSVNVQAVDY